MNIEKIKILSNKYQTIQKLQLPNILVTQLHLLHALYQVYHISSILHVIDVIELPKHQVTVIFELSEICLKGF